MSFFECEFPTAIAYQAQGGPMFSTSVNTGFSGYEQRNRNWAQALGKWKIDLSHKPAAYFNQVFAFWLNVGGRADAFRFKDHKDFSAVAQPLGLGNGTNKIFQLQRTYTSGGRSYVKPITKPVMASVLKFDGSNCSNTVNVYVGGVLKTLTTDYTLDATTGIVTLVTAPGGGVAVTADFQFHHPVRFDMDDCQATIEESDVKDGEALITWASVQLMEVRI